MSATSHHSSPELLWRPSEERIAGAGLTRFRELLAARGRSFPDYTALHLWSIREPELFWGALWDFCAVRAERRGAVVLEDDASGMHGARMHGARWFPEARLSFAGNLLSRQDEAPAVISYTEDGRRRELSFVELRKQSLRLAAALRARGVAPGDRVAALLPNVPETVVAMLAAVSLGATFSSSSPDFGVPAVLDRFDQIEPKVLFLGDEYRYGGKRFATRDRWGRLLGGLPSVELSVVVPFAGETVDVGGDSRLRLFADLLAEGEGSETEPLQLPFAHPLYILYSSGTTGRPKCVVHGAGGTLLQHLKEHRLHVDLGSGDRLFYFTTCGWMMWNWLVSGLATGATIVLYDGSPFFPGPGALFDLLEREAVTVFGTSAKFLDACAKAGVEPRRSHDLSSLRTLLSTGSPLLPESFDYVYEKVGADLHLASISGGTDIVSCFVLGDPTAPVYRGEIQCAGLGMAVQVFDEAGRPVIEEPGELVCTRPFPAMPVGFWGDEDGSRYRAAYFERYPGVWCHGDWTRETERGGFVIYGRSDAVLNPGGVRIGTAEIYRQVERFDEVVEAIVVGQEWEGDVRIVLFVKLREGLELDDELATRIRTAVRTNTSPRHVPARILQVPDIPRTRSGKITELAVRDVIHGREVKNLGALANPEALEHFHDRPELRE